MTDINNVEHVGEVIYVQLASTDGQQDSLTIVYDYSTKGVTLQEGQIKNLKILKRAI